jgi:hypothetical protein
MTPQKSYMTSGHLQNLEEDDYCKLTLRVNVYLPVNGLLKSTLTKMKEMCSHLSSFTPSPGDGMVFLSLCTSSGCVSDGAFCQCCPMSNIASLLRHKETEEGVNGSSVTYL